MEVILSHFSAAELRSKCLKAVQDELQHAETQLQPPLDALRRALSVVRASREMYRAPLVFVDESAAVAHALAQLVAACNEMGTIVREISAEMGSAGAGDASASTSAEQQVQVKAEPKVVATEHKQRKKAAKETVGREMGRVGEMGRVEEMGTGLNESRVEAKAAGVIDLSLSDDEKEDDAVVKEEERRTTGEAAAAVKKEVVEEKSTEQVAVVELEEVQRLEEKSSESAEVELSPLSDAAVELPTAAVEEEQEDDVRVPPKRKHTRKRKASQRIAMPPPKRTERDVVLRLRKRAEMTQSGDVGDAVGSALKAAIAVEERPDTTGIDSLITAFFSATAAAGAMLVEAHAQDPVEAECHLEDMRLLMSVAVENLEHGLSRDGVCAAWKMHKVLQKIHDLHPVKTKGLHRSCLQLYKCLVKEHEVPSDVVIDFRVKLDKLLNEVDEWSPLDGLSAKCGATLNLEGCLHLEKLLVVMRQVMYVRVDYAKVSRGATNALLGLFSPDYRPRFVYPEGCS
ncbi:uncharacterized protein IUM83_10100 [Phytophthora cinnamomi]|uniref:uncharacterized protein n=1 Tax=Phytophthora cinnamomi TaxID=4785 RepID=UPI003559925E|nr:hypothetical protein IUM83_10100 [Phytophthora cinnamomi]